MKSIISLTFLILLFLLSSSCSKKTVIGLYQTNCDKIEIGCTQLLLNTNHSFEFAVQIKEGSWKYAKGEWEILGDSILFTYHTKAKFPSDTLTNDNSTFKEIFLFDGNKIHPKSTAHAGFSEFYLKRTCVHHKKYEFGK